MDIKFILTLTIAIVVVLLFYEFSSFKKNINRKLNDIENKFNTSNQEIHNTVKRELLNSNNKFKTYTSEMVQEIRKMNKIENQHVTLISDGYDEDETVYSNKNIPYLSDTNQLCVSPRKKVKKSTADESLYMSETENDHMFIIKDDNNNILNSTHVNTTEKKSNINGVSDSKLSDDNNSNNTSSECKQSIHSKQSTHSNHSKQSTHSKQSKKSIHSNQSVHSDNKVLNDNINNLKRLQNDMDTDNELASQDITLDSTKDKQDINHDTVSNNIVDDLSLGTTDDTTFKLNHISKYNKEALIQIAKRYNIDIPNKINKENLYATLKQKIV